MSYYNKQMRILLSRRAGDWLLAHGSPRITALLGIVVGMLAAYACSMGLLSLGLQNMAGRFALNTIAGYIAFLLYLGWWLHSISPMPAKSLLIGTDRRIRTEVPGDTEFDTALEDSYDREINQLQPEAENVLAFVLGVGLMGLVYVSFHLMFHAPWYLGKLMVDTGKIQHGSAPTGSGLDVLVLPLRRSWPIAFLLVIHFAALGAVLQSKMAGG